MDGCVEEVLAPTLGAFAITGICCDVEDQGRIENAFPIVRSIKAVIAVEIGSAEISPNLFGHLFLLSTRKGFWACICWASAELLLLFSPIGLDCESQEQHHVRREPGEARSHGL